MKKIILIFISFFIIISCVGSDTEFLPTDILEAKNKNLLIKVYRPTNNKIIINQTEYLIQEAFTTFKYNSKYDKSINKNFFAFSLKLKNLTTNKEGLNSNDNDYINFYCNYCGGINTGNIVMSYKNITQRNTLDSIKIGFKNNDEIEKIIYFIQN